MLSIFALLFVYMVQADCLGGCCSPTTRTLDKLPFFIPCCAEVLVNTYCMVLYCAIIQIAPKPNIMGMATASKIVRADGIIRFSHPSTLVSQHVNRSWVYPHQRHNRASVCVRAESIQAPSRNPTSSSSQQLPRTVLYDCVSLGNLCVDVVLQVDQLPDSDSNARLQLLNNLSTSPPDVSTWEVGGACNFMIAAARLGMDIGCVGELAQDLPGEFLRQVMRNEGVSIIEPVLAQGHSLAQTLLCFVLVGPDGGHVFCSRYDFGPWPLLQGAQDVPPQVVQV